MKDKNYPNQHLEKECFLIDHVHSKRHKILDTTSWKLIFRSQFSLVFVCLRFQTSLFNFLFFCVMLLLKSFGCWSKFWIDRVIFWIFYENLDKGLLQGFFWKWLSDCFESVNYKIIPWFWRNPIKILQISHRFWKILFESQDKSAF